MKNEPKSSVAPADPAKQRRANRVHATILKPKPRAAVSGPAARASITEVMAAAPYLTTMASGIAQGTIRLEPSTMNALYVMKLLTVIN